MTDVTPTSVDELLKSKQPPARSLRTDVRNPLLTLPAAQRIRSLPADIRATVSALLAEIAADASARAEKCWRKHKAPMAAYWKAVAVYARHARRLTR